MTRLWSWLLVLLLFGAFAGAAAHALRLRAAAGTGMPDYSVYSEGADGLAAKFEGASKTVGTVAGTLHRSFSEAKKAGVAEMRRSRSNV